MDSSCVLVTGASGFLGQAIVQFLKPSQRVIACGTRRADDSVPAKDQHFFRLPSMQLRELMAAARPSWIIHCAGSSSVARSHEEPERDFAANVLVTESVYEAAAQACPSAKILFLSSAAVYGQPQKLPITEKTPTAPLSPYGYHKRECEWVAEDFRNQRGLAIGSLRLFSAYGPGLRKQVLWDIFEKSCRFRTVVLDGTGEETRDFVHVQDILELIQNIIRSDQIDFDCLNVASGRSISIRQLAEMFLDSLSYSGGLKFTGRLGPGIPTKWLVDNAKAIRFGFEPRMTLENGLSDYQRWVCQIRGDAGAHSILAAAG